MFWSDYFEKVQSEKQTAYGHCMAGRVKVVQAAQQLFLANAHFKDINQLGRQKISGLVKPSAQDDVDYRWFGSMMGAGKFWQAINNNDKNLSRALDLIQLSGEISRNAYLSYID